MRLAILGFVGGASLLQTRAALPDAWQLCTCVVAAMLMLAMLRGPARAAVAGALLGFAWAAFVASAALSDSLAKESEGRDVTIVGTIDNLPYRFEQGIRFNFKVEQIEDDGFHVPERVALGWYNGQHGSDARAADVLPGERWQLTVRLQRPHGNANPNGFDYEAWLLEQGIRATGYVRAGSKNKRLDAFVPGAGNVVERARALLRDRILQALPDKQYANVIVALVIGDQRGIDQSDWAVFNRTGIGHLISISGLHITMVAGMFALGVSALWRRSFFTDAQLPLLLPTQKAAALAGSGIALVYVLLAGFGVPAQRTLYMISVVAAALWFGRITSITHVLCAALGIVVLLDPWAMMWPGFWLSFGAVAVIMYAHAGRTGVARHGWRAAWSEGWRTQYAVTLGLVPATMLLFAQVSVVSPVANAVAIPLVSFVVTPLALAGAIVPAPLCTPLLVVAHWFVAMLAKLLHFLSEQPFAVWSAPEPAPWLFVLALAGTLWMLAPRGWPHRWAGAAAWLPLFAQPPSHPDEGRFRVTAFDVGQGMALLVETRGRRLLYDTGPHYSLDSNGGNRVIAPYLKSRGIATLDGMIISHSDTDHSGGALAMLDALPIGWVASSLWPNNPIVLKARRHLRCAAGQRWTWDGVAFEMLQPAIDSYADTALKANARSCTLRVSGGGRSVLLAGDIEAPQEARLVATMPDKLRADVLLAPHHGSGTSSTLAFLRAVAPEIAVFQVGYRNRYHHPKKEVADRYRALGIAQVRTDETGAIELDSADGFAARAYRTTHARYWYGR